MLNASADVLQKGSDRKISEDTIQKYDVACNKFRLLLLVHRPSFVANRFRPENI